MNLITHIMRKDIRHLRIPLLIWILLIALQAVLSGAGLTQSDDNLPLQVFFGMLSMLVPLLQFIVMLMIIPLLVQDEPLVGTTAFWLTRPIPPRVLLASKALFVVLALLLAPVLTEAFVMAAHGITAADLAYVIPEALLMTLVSVLLIMALAALTETFARFALVGVILWVLMMLVSFVVYMAQLFLNPERIVEHAGEMTLLASRQLVSSLLGVVLAAAVVVNQYLTRRIRRSMVLAALYVVVSLAVQQAWPWDLLALPHKPLAASDQGPAEGNLSITAEDLRMHDAERFSPGRRAGHELHARVEPPTGPEGCLVVPSRVRATLTFSNGVVRTTKSSLNSTQFGMAPDTKAIRHALEDARLLGAPNRISRDTDHKLIGLEAMDWNKLEQEPAHLKGTVEFQVLEYVVAARVPLKEHSEWKRGSDQVRVVGFKSRNNRLEVTLRTVAVRLAFKRGEGVAQRMGLSFNIPTVYVLINPERGEALLPENNQFNFDMFQGQQRLAVDRLTLQYERNLDADWLAGAFIYRLEPETRGYFEKTMDVPELTLASVRATPRHTFSTQSREKVDPDELAKITLLPNPDTNAVRAYVRAILAVSENSSSYSDNDPQVRMLCEVGPEFLPVLTEFDRQYHLDQAIRRLAGPEHKALVLERLPEQHDLIKVVIANGWTEDARDTLLDELASGSEFLPTEWVQAVAAFKDPATYPALRSYFIHGKNRPSTYRAIRDLPGMDLTNAVHQAWRSAKFSDDDLKHMLPVALECGVVDALEEALAAKSKHEGSSSQTLLQALQESTGQTGTIDDIRGWYQAHKGQFYFDPATKHFVPSP